MAEHPATDGVILAHTTLAALTPLIPVPFVDTVVQNRVMRRMVRKLAELHHLRIWDPEVETLADEKGGNLFFGIAKGAVLAPIKRLLRKTFMFLAGKRIVDLASECYHRGFLVERAFANGWCAPHGKTSAKDLREAIDQVLAREPMAASPVTRALRLGFEGAQSTLFDVYTSLRERFGGGNVEQAIDDAAESDEGIGGVIASLYASLTEVPTAHFDELEGKLRRQLYGDSAGADITVSESSS